MRVGIKVGLVAAVVGILVQTAAADPGGAAPHRPFKSGVVQFSTSLGLEERCGDDLTLAVTVVGTATHLGRLSGTGTHCTKAALTVEAVPFYAGLATWTAADGSTLNLRYEGQQAAPVGGVAMVTLTVEVVSGTGRFEGASGLWTGSGTINFATFSGEATLSGWLSY